MHQMKATREFMFAGRSVMAGEQITATVAEARTLRSLKWAEPVREYETRVLVVEEAKPSKKPRRARQKRDPNNPKRAYRRRDMQAEA